jgi:hypothetical protein
MGNIVNIARKGSAAAANMAIEQRSYDLTWSVLFDGPDTDGSHATKAERAIGLPGFGDRYPTDAWATVRRKRVRTIVPTLCEVDVTYATPANSGGRPGSDPLAQPPRIGIDVARNVEPIDIDLDGKVIANTAGVLFEGVTQEYDDPVLVVERNYAQINMATITQYRNAINSDWFLDEPGRAMMDAIKADLVSEPSVKYWAVSFRVQFREGFPPSETPLGQIGGPARAWWRRLPNVGTEELVGSHPQTMRPIYRKIIDPDTLQPVSRPVPLDAAGLALPQGQPVIPLEFRTRKSMPFGVLNILAGAPILP